MIRRQQIKANARASFSLFRIKSAEGFQYRLAFMAGASTSILWGLIEIAVLTAFYHYAENRDAGITAGLTLRQVVTYAWLVQMLFIMQPMNIDRDIYNLITSGNVGIEPAHASSHRLSV